MNNKSCVDNHHQYGLWNMDKEKNQVWRICNECKFCRELPITEEICEEIQKQEEASNLFKAFQMVDNHDENLINYLNLILEDYINYLDRKNTMLLVKRMKELEQLDIIDIQDILYNNQLNVYFETDNINNNDEILIQQNGLSVNIDSFEQS